MNYPDKLAAMKADPDIKLRDIGDEWRTPDNLYWGAFQLYGPFVLDLFTDGDNAKCDRFYTAQDNALIQPWAEHLNGGTAFANPPYSRSSYDENNQPTTGMRHIVAKAMAEREQGARVVFLIKAAPSEGWWPEHADHVCWIKGRVGFDLPLWAQHLKASSAGFGQAIVVFDKHWRGERERYIARDVLEQQGQQLMDAIEQRAQQLAATLTGSVSPESAPQSPEQVPQSSELEPVSSELGDTDTDDGIIQPEPEPESEPNKCSLVALHNRYLNGELTTTCWAFSLATLIVVYGDQEEYDQSAIDDVFSMEDFSVFTMTERGISNEQRNLIINAGLSAKETMQNAPPDCLSSPLAAIRQSINDEKELLASYARQSDATAESEESGTTEEVTAEQLDYTLDDLHHQYINGDLPADDWPHFISTLVVLFGEQERYGYKKVRFALTSADQGDIEVTSGVAQENKNNIKAAAKALCTSLHMYGDIAVEHQAAAIKLLCDANHRCTELSEREALAYMRPYLKQHRPQTELHPA